MQKVKTELHGLPRLQELISYLHVPRTTQFNDSIPYTKINNYKFHTEIFGKTESTPIIVVHGGPGIDYEYLKPLKNLSKDYRVIFYDQRGTGLSPRVEKKFLTLEQNVEDLHSIAEHFSNGKKVKIIGHSWGAMLTVGFLSKYPETVSQAVIVEPAFLYPGAPVKKWSKDIKKWLSIWTIARCSLGFPFVHKEDGHEAFDYVATKVANYNKPGAPYNCEGQELPAGIFKRMGYQAYNNILKPVLDDPDSFSYDFTKGISNFHGDLMLISSECSILGHEFQEKFNLPKLPSQTVHIKAERMGHHMITLNPEWSLQTIGNFFNPKN